MRSVAVPSDEQIPHWDEWSLEQWLWAITITALLGDIVTTMIGLRIGLAEGNPVVRTFLDVGGVTGLVAAKCLALGLGVAVRYPLKPSVRPAIPAGLAVPSVVIVVNNVFLIAATI